MHYPRLMVAAPKSNSGKTLLTCLLIKLMLGSKLKTAAFKCGPDYIDPMFHKRVLGVPSKNLDTFFTDVKKTRKLFMENAANVDISIIEGVMGLYDGLGGVSEKASSYDVARALRCPIIFVCDVHGMGGTSLAAEIRGFMDYDRDNLIKGIFLNGISSATYEYVKRHLESELKIPVIGYYSYDKNLKFDTRHLGLIMPDEIKDLNLKLNMAAGNLARNINFEKILEIAQSAEDVNWEVLRHRVPNKDLVPVGKAADEAFRFYYEDNLNILRDFGCKLVPFSPIHDKQIPAGVKGLIFYGGYPELYAKQLSANTSMIESIRAALAQNMPSIAECGGFMYLGTSIEAEDGTEYPMVGAVSSKFFNTGHLVRFGYMSISEKEDSFLGNGRAIRGHEFHYYNGTENGSSCVAYKPIRAKTWDCAYVDDFHWWGWPHLYYSSCPSYAENFIRKCRRFEVGKFE